MPDHAVWTPDGTLPATEPATSDISQPVSEVAIVEAISTVYDPEIPVNIYELGLIYDIVVRPNQDVLIAMTLTSPACPSAQELPAEVREAVLAVPGVREVVVDIVWNPPWDPSLMSEEAKLALNMF